MKILYKNYIYEATNRLLKHFGDLGKGSDTYLGRVSQGSPGHGHFGTGTYFISNNNELSRNAPVHVVDSSNYNLLVLTDFFKALKIHDILAKVNQAVEDPTVGLEELSKEISNRIGRISKEDLEEIIKERRDLCSPTSKEDSASTVLLKHFGYEGVDVSQIEQMDDFRFGSVIFNLK
jgi:hypothetical protein